MIKPVRRIKAVKPAHGQLCYLLNDPASRVSGNVGQLVRNFLPVGNIIGVVGRDTAETIYNTRVFHLHTAGRLKIDIPASENIFKENL